MDDRRQREHCPKGVTSLARYAISPEGANDLRTLARGLYESANAIIEASTLLNSKIVAIEDSLGIYGSEIQGIAQQIQNSLRSNRESIIELGQSIQGKASEIEGFFSITNATSLASAAAIAAAAGGATGKPLGTQELLPNRSAPRDLAASQFGFSKDTDGNMVYDSPMEMDQHLYSTQGEAYTNIQGTCGLCSCANVLRLSGVDVGEKQMVDHAMSNHMCLFDKDDSGASGGTTPFTRQQILSDYGIPSHTEVVQTGANGLPSDATMNSIADNVFSGRGVIVSVDAGHFYSDARYYGGGHALTVTSVKTDTSGNILGYYVCDSNKGTTYITKEHLRRSLRASHINVTDTIIR